MFSPLFQATPHHYRPLCTISDIESPTVFFIALCVSFALCCPWLNQPGWGTSELWITNEAAVNSLVKSFTHASLSSRTLLEMEFPCQSLVLPWLGWMLPNYPPQRLSQFTLTKHEGFLHPYRNNVLLNFYICSLSFNLHSSFYEWDWTSEFLRAIFISFSVNCICAFYPLESWIVSLLLSGLWQLSICHYIKEVSPL